ncbi:unnamed protein product [Arctogadus glacialis]
MNIPAVHAPVVVVTRQADRQTPNGICGWDDYGFHFLFPRELLLIGHTRGGGVMASWSVRVRVGTVLLNCRSTLESRKCRCCSDDRSSS